MNKNEFLQQLEAELDNVSLEERMAALQYFTMYFEDAGPEQEQQVIGQLGSPEKVAADVRAGGEDGGEGWKASTKEKQAAKKNAKAAGKTETVLADRSAAMGMPEAPGTQAPWAAATPLFPSPPAQPQPAYAAPTAYAQPQAQQQGVNPLKVLLVVFLAITLVPTLGGLIVSLCTILFVPFVVGIVLIISGIAVLAAGSLLFAVTLGNSLLTLGGGMFCLGLGLLCTYFGIWTIGKAIPALWRGFVSFIKGLVS
jgi:uncharacterized membrane protein